ncbi:MAG: translation initiation factor IF-2 [Bacteroidetes bacterium GWE2_39_28]|nr:MAG: translation initiation factor IF-2 [Bacteroidetes bacterium GWE2_39_28]OFY16046.1 MAG: translation initiation factor IF-2 [Bacteroidetes bacterium GWF2_39_10]OFZ10071.1 MAG: translation initiation factor IF-2 [Bacteroidetes bacterium RIFOXYC2_FULL_39_11]HCT94404.1 translation initiation factor IF-2 [Rikenellaceae bacterium]
MTVNESIRINKVLKEFNIGLGTLVDFFKSKKIEIEANPGTKITPEMYELVQKEFGKELLIKEQSKKVAIKVKDITDKAESHKDDDSDSEDEMPVKEVFIKTTIAEPPTPKIIGKIDLSSHERPKHIFTPEPQPETVIAKVVSEPVVKPEVKPEIKPEVKPEIKPEVNAEAAIEVTPEAKPQVIQDVNAEVKPEIKEEAKPLIIQEVKSEIKEEVKPEVNEEIKTEVKEEIQSEAKVEVTPVAQTESKPPVISQQPQTEVKQEPTREVKPEVVKTAVKPDEKAQIEKEQNIAPVIEHIETKVERLVGPKISGTLDLSQFEKKKSEPRQNGSESHKGKRERIRKPQKEKVDLSKESKNNPARPIPDRNNIQKKNTTGKPLPKEKFKPVRTEVDEDQVQKQIKETYARMTEGKGKAKGAKYRKDKRDHASQKLQEEHEIEQLSSSTLKVTEFVTVNDLAIMMDVAVIKVIEACMNLGLMVSINQRLDAEAMVLVAEEFGFKVEFVTADIQDSIQEEEDSDGDLVTRPPIVTVMGHVDHGKTSLLDYIRKANVIAGEAGGITQHIGAYNVKIASGERITFLDTPGHEAFTAMRARGAKVTDIAIIIIAADDFIMPQTREAINHAQAAGVPMIFAINKIDKPGANAEKIREQLANMNLLVEDWGGKYQCQEISAKQGLNVDKLLEKILLESELLDLKANPAKRAKGTIIESSLDKGRGYLATVLVQSGTLHIGDILLSGSQTGRIKAMFNERGQKITEAGPSTPVSILGLNGAPAAGELFNVMEDEKEARDIANKREQLIRIQGLKTQKHITLEEIGRRIAIGNFQELNIIVKADVDGSIEALSDSLIKLSTEEVHVNVIHKAVGAISESDVLLAAASNAIIIGFQVRPSTSARKIADKEQIEIRLYSVIYDAINEVKDGMEGMLAPEKKEEITATAEVREVFRISKVGTIAGCMVKEGKLTRNAKVRIIRDGIVIYSGSLGSLKRFKEDVKEVASGYDCGLNIDGYNDVRNGDIIEAYTIVEIKRKL